MTYAIIPAKSFTGAKQRLATFLQPHERRLLARAMRLKFAFKGSYGAMSGARIATRMINAATHPQKADRGLRLVKVRRPRSA